MEITTLLGNKDVLFEICSYLKHDDILTFTTTYNLMLDKDLVSLIKHDNYCILCELEDVKKYGRYYDCINCNYKNMCGKHMFECLTAYYDLDNDNICKKCCKYN